MTATPIHSCEDPLPDRGGQCPECKGRGRIKCDYQTRRSGGKMRLPCPTCGGGGAVTITAALAHMFLSIKGPHGPAEPTEHVEWAERLAADAVRQRDVPAELADAVRAWAPDNADELVGKIREAVQAEVPA